MNHICLSKSLDMRLLTVLFCLIGLSGLSQSQFHLEGRFCGIEKCRSLIGEMQSPFFGAWMRVVNYPGSMQNQSDFPADQGSLGYSLLGEVGLPQVKFVFGSADGEWVKGLHINGTDEEGRFRSHLLLYHRPPTQMDAFRLDGEFSIEHFSKRLNGLSRSGGAGIFMGAMLRIECYEPAPIAFHTGLSIKRWMPGKKSTEQKRRPGGDFNESLDPYFLNSFKSKSFISDWTLSVGPTLFMDWSTGGNVNLRYLF